MGLKPSVFRKLRARGIRKNISTHKKFLKQAKRTAVARQKKKSLSTAQIVKLVLKFSELISGKTLYSYQIKFAKRIIMSVLQNDGSTVTGLFSRQSGKTEVVAQVVLACAILLPALANQPIFRSDPRFNRYWTDNLGNKKYSGLKDGMLIGIYAPVDDQAKIAFNRIREMLTKESAKAILKDRDFLLEFDTFNGRCITMRNTQYSSFIGSFSASEGTNIEGKTYHLVIIDECQDIGDYKLDKSIVPFLAYNNGSMVQIGTPGLHKAAFYRNINTNKKLEREEGLRNHFEYDYLFVQRQNPQYKKFVAQEILKLGGIDNDEFRMNFMLKWMLDRGMFISDDQLRACGKDYDLDQLGTGWVVAGVDWAKKIDSTVITILDVDKNIKDPLGRSMKRIISWGEFHGIGYQSQINDIKQMLYKYNVQFCVSDETGVGNMPTEILKELAPPNCIVHPVNFSKRQLMTDIWMNLSTEFLGGRLFYPSSKSAQKDIRYKHFQEQFLDLEKDTSKGYLTCHAPEGKHYHDDYCDSLALANYGVEVAEHEIVDLDMADDTNFEDSPFYKVGA